MLSWLAKVWPAPVYEILCFQAKIFYENLILKEQSVAEKYKNSPTFRFIFQRFTF